MERNTKMGENNTIQEAAELIKDIICKSKLKECDEYIMNGNSGNEVRRVLKLVSEAVRRIPYPAYRIEPWHRILRTQLNAELFEDALETFGIIENSNFGEEENPTDDSYGTFANFYARKGKYEDALTETRKIASKTYRMAILQDLSKKIAKNNHFEKAKQTCDESWSLIREMPSGYNKGMEYVDLIVAQTIIGDTKGRKKAFNEYCEMAWEKREYGERALRPENSFMFLPWFLVTRANDPEYALAVCKIINRDEVYSSFAHEYSLKLAKDGQFSKAIRIVSLYSKVFYEAVESHIRIAREATKKEQKIWVQIALLMAKKTIDKSGQSVMRDLMFDKYVLAMIETGLPCVEYDAKKFIEKGGHEVLTVFVKKGDLSQLKKLIKNPNLSMLKSIIKAQIESGNLHQIEEVLELFSDQELKNEYEISEKALLVLKIGQAHRKSSQPQNATRYFLEATELIGRIETPNYFFDFCGKLANAFAEVDSFASAISKSALITEKGFLSNALEEFVKTYLGYVNRVIRNDSGQLKV